MFLSEENMLHIVTTELHFHRGNKNGPFVLDSLTSNTGLEFGFLPGVACGRQAKCCFARFRTLVENDVTRLRALVIYWPSATLFLHRCYVKGFLAVNCELMEFQLQATKTPPSAASLPLPSKHLHKMWRISSDANRGTL